MQISLNKENGVLTVCVNGRVDTVTAPELEKTVFENLEGVSQLCLDLKEMPYTSSAGLRVFLMTQKQMTKQGGTMKVLNVCEDVYEVLEMTGFSDIMDIERI
ncbi:MAG: STAS domain-containing protein [Clostridia bacterium]|nr:STAS domain-containing protein [Clostridia bacterium]